MTNTKHRIIFLAGRLAAVAIALVGVMLFAAIHEAKPVQAQSSDSTLSSLTISSGLAKPFDPAHTQHFSFVSRDVEQVTVTATATDSGATLEYGQSPDADPNQPGHQVDLGDNYTGISVTVTAADGTTTKIYVIWVWRPPAPTESLSVAAASGPEGGAVVFTVSLSAAYKNPVFVKWTASTESGDTATANADYSALTNRRLRIPSGDTSATFSVPIAEDTVYEADETFTVTLSDPTNALLATATAKGTIIDSNANVWSATLRVDQVGAIEYGCLGTGTASSSSCAHPATLSNKDVTYRSTKYSITRLQVEDPDANRLLPGQLRIVFDTGLSTDAQKLTLWVGSRSYPFEDANTKTSRERRWNNSGLDWSRNDRVSLRITGPVVTLSALSVSSGTLTPAFVPGITDYIAMVDSSVDQVTLEYPAADSDATVAVQSGSDGALTDAESATAGFQVNLGATGSATTVKVKVTNQSIVNTYSVTVHRGAVTVPEKEVPYNWPLIPRGLGPGDSFRLLFVTSTGRNATATSIADYDAFVQGRAAAGHAEIRAHSAHFRALASVASTAPVHARLHTATVFNDSDKGVPIYWLGWRKAARNYEDFYDGIWMEERGIDEFGADLGAIPGPIWTGSSDIGTATVDKLGASNPTVGQLNKQWDAAENPLSASTTSKSDSHPLYALSGVFTVAEPAPAVNELALWVEGMQLRTWVRWGGSSDADVTGYQIQRALQFRPDNGGSTFADPGQPRYEVVAPDIGNITSYDIDGQHARNFTYRALPIKNGVPQSNKAIRAQASTSVVPPEVHVKWNDGADDGLDTPSYKLERRELDTIAGSFLWDSTTPPSTTIVDDSSVLMPSHAFEYVMAIEEVNPLSTKSVFLGPVTVNIPHIVGERYYCALNNSWTTFTHPGTTSARDGARVPVSRPETWFQLDTDVDMPIAPNTGPFTVRVTQASRDPLNPNHGCFPLAIRDIPALPVKDQVFEGYDQVRFTNGFVAYQDTLERHPIGRFSREKLGERLPADATVIGSWSVEAQLDFDSPSLWREGVPHTGVVVYDLVTTGRTVYGDEIRFTNTRTNHAVWEGWLTVKDVDSGNLGCWGLALTGGGTCGDSNVLRPTNRFTYDSRQFSIRLLRLSSNGQLALSFAQDMSEAVRNLILRVGDKTFNLRYPNSGSLSLSRWDNSGLTWSVGEVVNVRLEPPVTPVRGGRMAEGDLASPQNLEATSQSGRVELTWDAVEGATGYRVLRKGQTDSEHLQIATPTASSHTDRDVTVNESYSYRVEAVNASGSSDASEPVTVTVMPPPPLAPTGLTATASGTSVKVAWQAPEHDYIEGYMVLRLAQDADPPEDPQGVAQVEAETTEVTDTGVQAGTAYEYRVVSFNLAGQSEPAKVSVTVPAEDENAAPEFSDSSYDFSVAEDAAVDAAVGTVSATDPDDDTLAYSITAGNGDGMFAINGSSGAITVAKALDHETEAAYTLTVQADDGNDGTDTTTVNVSVTNVNEDPAFAAASYDFAVAEDAAVGASVGGVSATDPDGDTLAYSITAGDSDGKFAISGDGAITVAAALDYETDASYALTVQADDGNGGSDTTTVNVSVTDVDEPQAQCPPEGVDLADFDNADRVVVSLAWLKDNEAAVWSGDPVVIPKEAILAFYKSRSEEIPLTSIESITLSPYPIGSHDYVDGVEGFSYERSLITHVTFTEGCVHAIPGR